MAKDYIEIIQKTLDQRKVNNSSYSLRSFARDLNCSASWLSMVLSGKKGISVEKATNLIGRLKLNSNDRQIFILSVKLNSEKNKDLKKIFSENIIRLKNRKTFDAKKDMIIPETWIIFSVLESIEVLEDKANIQKICLFLEAPEDKVKTVIEKLLQLNFIYEENGVYRIVVDSCSTTNEVTSEEISKHHQNISKLSIQAIEQQKISDRDFQNIIFSFDSSQVPEVKKFILECQEKFVERFCYNLKNKDSVYSFSTQFFRLNKLNKKN